MDQSVARFINGEELYRQLLFATYAVFDVGKREQGGKESTAQAQAADLAVQLTKAKVAAAVKSSYFELERSRQLAQSARRMVSATQVLEELPTNRITLKVNRHAPEVRETCSGTSWSIARHIPG